MIDKITDFQTIFKEGHRAKGDFFVSHAKPGTPWRVGVVASKKRVSKRAVDRNRVKRRLRALVRGLLGEGTLFSKSFFLVISADRKTIDAPWDALTQELKRQLVSHESFFATRCPVEKTEP